MSFSRIISASLSPNTDGADVWAAVGTLLRPDYWINGHEKAAVETWFAKRLGTPHVVSFNSGRSALFAVLGAFGIGKGDEVICQAFTCVAVPNAVIWTGATPVFADIDDSLNIDPNDLEKKITAKTRAVIVQHTLGTPADMERIMIIARKHGVIVVEDCAHSLGASVEGQEAGAVGDAAIFSFGRDKVISSVFGGLAAISKKHAGVFGKLDKTHNQLANPTRFWILQQILHPILFSLILPVYRLGIGKGMLVFFQKIGLLGFPVYPEEKSGMRPGLFPKKYPNALARLLLVQLQKLDALNAERASRAKTYLRFAKNNPDITLPKTRAGAIFLRFPVLVPDPGLLGQRARNRGILLGNWYHNVIDPSGVDFARIGYTEGSCPRAEEAARHIINLPTRISDEEIGRVISALT